ECGERLARPAQSSGAERLQPHFGHEKRNKGGGGCPLSSIANTIGATGFRASCTGGRVGCGDGLACTGAAGWCWGGVGCVPAGGVAKNCTRQIGQGSQWPDFLLGTRTGRPHAGQAVSKGMGFPNEEERRTRALLPGPAKSLKRTAPGRRPFRGVAGLPR